MFWRWAWTLRFQNITAVTREDDRRIYGSHEIYVMPVMTEGIEK